MSKNNIKVGSRVRIVSEYVDEKKNAFGYSGDITGKTGTVTGRGSIPGYPFIVAVDETNREIHVHKVELLTPAKERPEFIIIKHDGKTTTAQLRKGKTVLKEATAVCSDGDEFKFRFGATLAFGRLVGADILVAGYREKQFTKPNLEKIRVVCTKTSGIISKEIFTAGKVYNACVGAGGAIGIFGGRTSLPFFTETVDDSSFRVAWNAHDRADFIPFVGDEKEAGK